MNPSEKIHGAINALKVTPPPSTIVPVAATGPPRRNAVNMRMLAPEMHSPLTAASAIPVLDATIAGPRGPNR